MTAPIRLAIVGFGKIARDQHLPAIRTSSNYELAAIVSREGWASSDVPVFRDVAELATSGIDLDAVALCTPPQPRRAIAQFSLEQGWHVFLEKPPGATLAEVVALHETASMQGVSLFASWHSKFAEGVEPARSWLADRVIQNVTITWREDVRVWHPGQEWIWEPGGFGVFDPGINALSIATRILPRPFFVEEAELDLPANRAAPIAARVAFRDTSGKPIQMDLDFRQEGPQSWDIVVTTNDGVLELRQGGSLLSINGRSRIAANDDLAGEYPGLYRRFAELILNGESEVDVAPLRLVADIYLRGRWRTVEPFVE